MFAKLIISFFALLYLPTSLAVVNNELPIHTARTVSSGDVLNWSVGLLIVLAIFFLSVWVMRKSGQLPVGGVEKMRVLSGLSLGMREKVVLLQVGQKQLVLGVTPGRIETLHVLEGDDRLLTLQPTETGNGNSFSVKLKQAMKGTSRG